MFHILKPNLYVSFKFLGLLNSICLEVMKEKYEFEFKFNIMFNSIT